MLELRKTPRQGLLFSYPAAFQMTAIKTADDVELCCFIASRPEEGRPTLGMFNATSMNIIISLAERAYRRWGGNVAVAEMRS